MNIFRSIIDHFKYIFGYRYILKIRFEQIFMPENDYEIIEYEPFQHLKPEINQWFKENKIKYCIRQIAIGGPDRYQIEFLNRQEMILFKLWLI